ncbi:MAG: glycerol kinase, partial [Blastocatellia bacterium]|nr:glycerol kinase [Blastocatellia bacterium]
MSYILSIDQGTTGTKVLIFDHEGDVRASAYAEFKQYYPRPGWVEHDANEIWLSCIALVKDALSKARVLASELRAIGITNQRETTLVWDRVTGEPVYNAIVWQDRRTASLCNALIADGHAERIHDRTGLVIDPYFSATKVKWILDNVAGARDRAAAGTLAFGTIDSWLVWKLTRGAVHAT